MSESVEQAALRRATEQADDLPAPFGSIFSAIDAVARLNDTRYRDLSDRYRYVCDTNAALEVQVSEQADAILALSNRIEAVNRDHRALYGAYMAHIESAPHGCMKGHPATTSVQAKRGEAGIAQAATATGRGIATAVPLPSPRVPMWVCLCGARNRLRNTACRACGNPKPDWKDDYDDRRD